MICKHFNISWTDIRDDLTFEEYYCLLAESLDAEELEHYHFAALTHGKEAVKKWKWSSPDKAGTQAIPDKMTRQNASKLSVSPLAENLIKSYMDQIDTDTRIARAREFAGTSGKPIGYMTPDNKLIDGDGKEIEKLPGMLIVRLNG